MHVPINKKWQLTWKWQLNGNDSQFQFRIAAITKIRRLVSIETYIENTQALSQVKQREGKINVEFKQNQVLLFCLLLVWLRAVILHSCVIKLNYPKECTIVVAPNINFFVFCKTLFVFIWFVFVVWQFFNMLIKRPVLSSNFEHMTALLWKHRKEQMVKSI